MKVPIGKFELFNIIHGIPNTYGYTYKPDGYLLLGYKDTQTTLRGTESNIIAILNRSDKQIHEQPINCNLIM